MSGQARAAGVRAQRGGFMMGLVAGLLLGLALALGVALYITKAPIPFINKVPQRTAEQDAAEAIKNKNWDPNAPLAGKAGARRGAASGVVGEPAASAGAATDAAPGAASAPPPVAARAARDAASGAAGQAAAPARPGAAAPAAAASAGVAGFNYFVQAGAYARPEDAESQRAKVGLLGMAAKVMAREQSGRTVYRVRIGPFEGREEAEATQARLGESAIESSLVRVER